MFHKNCAEFDLDIIINLIVLILLGHKMSGITSKTKMAVNMLIAFLI